MKFVPTSNPVNLLPLWRLCYYNVIVFSVSGVSVGSGFVNSVLTWTSSFRLGAKEIAEFLGMDPAAATGYFRRERGFQDKAERLILFLEGGRKNLNNLV